MKAVCGAGRRSRLSAGCAHSRHGVDGGRSDFWPRPRGKFSFQRARAGVLGMALSMVRSVRWRSRIFRCGSAWSRSASLFRRRCSEPISAGDLCRSDARPECPPTRVASAPTLSALARETTDPRMLPPRRRSCPDCVLERQNTDVPHVGQKYVKNWLPSHRWGARTARRARDRDVLIRVIRADAEDRARAALAVDAMACDDAGRFVLRDHLHGAARTLCCTFHGSRITTSSIPLGTVHTRTLRVACNACALGGHRSLAPPRSRSLRRRRPLPSIARRDSRMAIPICKGYGISSMRPRWSDRLALRR